MLFGDIIISGYILVALNNPSVFPLKNVGVAQPVISAKSAFVFDTKRDKVLFDKASQEMLPAASLTKILSALVVLDTIPLDRTIIIDQKSLDAFGDAGDFKLGEKVEARHLLFSALIASSNDAMFALANDIGMENFLSLMRSKAIQLGLRRVVIDDPAGLSPKTRIPASEYSKIAEAGFSNNFIAQVLGIPEYTFKSLSGRAHKLISTSPLIFDQRIAAAKTGSLREVGENYATFVKGDDGQPRFITVLIGSSDRTKDMLALINWLDKGFVWR